MKLLCISFQAIEVSFVFVYWFACCSFLLKLLIISFYLLEEIFEFGSLELWIVVIVAVGIGEWVIGLLLVQLFGAVFMNFLVVTYVNIHLGIDETTLSNVLASQVTHEPRFQYLPIAA